MGRSGLTLRPAAASAIRHHGRETYPHECCGALIGLGGLVTAALALPNTTDDGAVSYTHLTLPTIYSV